MFNKSISFTSDKSSVLISSLEKLSLEKSILWNIRLYTYYILLYLLVMSYLFKWIIWRF